MQNEFDTLNQRIKALEDKINLQSKSPFYSIWNFGIWAVVTVILFFVLLTTVIRVQRLLQDNTPQLSPSSQSDSVLRRANEAVDSVELVLSFLEGASVLLAVALSAATLYGLRQSKELKEDFAREVIELKKDLNDQLSLSEKQIATMQESLNQKSVDILNAQDYIEQRKPQLEELANIENLLKKSQSTLIQTINDVSLLLQADQEFRLRNHTQAYEFISQVLEHDTDVNPNNLALYMAGWLEIHHIPEKLDSGLERLQKLSTLLPGWPSAKAAYGVALRRKAMKLDEQAETKAEAQNYLRKAHSALYEALKLDPNLVDFNRESFWGPIGGILRDTQDIEGAIAAYKKALQVTPGSSYPQGNLANLYLRKAQSNNEFQDDMLNEFEKTLQYARAELNQTPNDYFLIMDMAMAETILGYKDKENLVEAQKHLQQALKMNTSVELLSVSNRGWTFLRNALPEAQQWHSVRHAIDDSIEFIAKEIKKREAPSTAISS